MKMMNAAQDQERYFGNCSAIEGVGLRFLGREVGTPFYLYSSTASNGEYVRWARYPSSQGVHICFAVNANGTLSVLRPLATVGAGADSVSGGELARTLRAGILARRIIFPGSSKSPTEIRAALEVGVGQIAGADDAILEAPARGDRRTPRSIGRHVGARARRHLVTVGRTRQHDQLKGKKT